MMDPFRLCLSMAPLSFYLLVLAVVNFRRRPLVVAGTRDLAALGLSVVGLLVVGPVELLLPAAAMQIGGYFWLLMMSVYLLVLTLGVMLCAPRLVVYNVSLDQLRPVLAETVNELDPEARWAGSSVALPQLGIELYIDDYPPVRNVSLIATSSRQSYSGWGTLERSLREKLKRTVENPPNAWGFSLLLVALAMLARMGWDCYFHGGEVAQGFAEMMRF